MPNIKETYDVVVVGAGVHAERTEELGKGDEQQRLVGEDRLDACEDARAVDRLHNSLFGDECEVKGKSAADKGGENAAGNIKRTHRELENAAADKVDEHAHENFGSLLNEAGEEVCLSDKTGPVDDIGRDGRRHTRPCNSNKGARKVGEELQYQIERQLGRVIKTSVAENERHHPEKEAAKHAGACINDEPGLEFTPTGPGLIDDSRKEHIVDDIPNTYNKSNYLLEFEADSDNIRNKNIIILVDIKALGNIIEYISHCLFRPDIASVLRDGEVPLLLLGCLSNSVSA